MLARVFFESIRSVDDDPAWDDTRCLYAIVSPGRPRLLYIGAVTGWTSSVRRVHAAGYKLDGIWRDIGRGYHRLLVGAIELPQGRRLTRKLLLDIESVLIERFNPRHNRLRCRYRRGLEVRCYGAEWRG